MSVDTEAGAYKNEKKISPHSTQSQPLAPTKSRSSFIHTLDNKPDDVDAAIWMEEVSVVGVQERKVSRSCVPRAGCRT